MTLKNKKILVIIGGGIAAYKSLDLIRLLKKNNVDVKTILTKSGREFVTPLSLSTLTKSKTYENMFDSDSEAEIDHIALSRWADIIVVMPTTANLMSKLSIGKEYVLQKYIVNPFLYKGKKFHLRVYFIVSSVLDHAYIYDKMFVVTEIKK